MADTLFNNIADLRTIIPQIQSSADAADIFPYLEEARIEYMDPYLSEDFYDEIRAALVAASYVVEDLTAEEQAIVNHLRRAEAYYGFYVAMPNMIADVSSSGFKESTNDRTTGPRQWVVKDARQNYIKKADLFIDKALAVMEGDPDSYSTWSESANFTIYHEHLLSKVDNFIGISGSRRTFVKLRNYIKQAEDRYVVPAMSRQLLDALITKKKAATAFSTFESQLVDYLYQGISHYALFMGAPELLLDVSNEGIRVVSTSDGITSKTTSDRQLYSDWMRRIEGTARHYMAMAKMYLDDNASQFTDYTTEAANKKEPNIYTSNSITGTSGSVMI